ncbi:MAG TPA: hypothetical protein VJ406_00690 [Dehalococcoidia bacterium]|nr:hypothetical protein [Dehalococcoidia bacterium]
MARGISRVSKAVIPEALLYLASWRPRRDMEPAPRRSEENRQTIISSKESEQTPSPLKGEAR